MISFEGFVMTDGSPIYSQIIRHIQRGVVAGEIRDGDELPSRRVLSSLLGVNPNTVQKAYRLLEDDGLLSSRVGTKSCISLDETKYAAIRAALLEASVRELIVAMRKMGVSLGETQELIKTYWEDIAV